MPKLFIIIGPSGSGKSTIQKEHFPDLPVLNYDRFYESCLVRKGIGLNLLKANQEDRVEAGKCSYVANKETDEEFESLIDAKIDFVYDCTGGSTKSLLAKATKARYYGYKIHVIYTFCSLETSFKRNLNRSTLGGRTLYPSIILNSWYSVTNNFAEYKQYFGDDMITVMTESGFVPIDVKRIDNKYIIPYRFKDLKHDNPKYLDKKKRDKERMFKNITSSINVNNINNIIRDSYNQFNIYNKIQEWKEA